MKKLLFVLLLFATPVYADWGQVSMECMSFKDARVHARDYGDRIPLKAELLTAKRNEVPAGIYWVYDKVPIGGKYAPTSLAIHNYPPEDSTSPSECYFVAPYIVE